LQEKKKETKQRRLFVDVANIATSAAGDLTKFEGNGSHFLRISPSFHSYSLILLHSLPITSFPGRQRPLPGPATQNLNCATALPRASLPPPLLPPTSPPPHTVDAPRRRILRKTPSLTLLWNSFVLYSLLDAFIHLFPGNNKIEHVKYGSAMSPIGNCTRASRI